MEEVVEGLLAAAGAGLRITVHGDYDVDGVCSTAILVAALRERGRRLRLVHPRPHGRRLRPLGGDRSPARRPRHPAPADRRLRDRLRGRGRAGPRARRRGDRHRPPRARRAATGLPDPAPEGLGLPIRGAMRDRGGPQARLGAAGTRRDRRRRRALRPRPRRARDRRRPRAPAGREPRPRARGPRGSPPRRAARACGRWSRPRAARSSASTRGTARSGWRRGSTPPAGSTARTPAWS